MHSAIDEYGAEEHLRACVRSSLDCEWEKHGLSDRTPFSDQRCSRCKRKHEDSETSRKYLGPEKANMIVKDEMRLFRKDWKNHYVNLTSVDFTAHYTIEVPQFVQKNQEWPGYYILSLDMRKEWHWTNPDEERIKFAKFLGFRIVKTSVPGLPVSLNAWLTSPVDYPSINNPEMVNAPMRPKTTGRCLIL